MMRCLCSSTLSPSQSLQHSLITFSLTTHTHTPLHSTPTFGFLPSSQPTSYIVPFMASSGINHHTQFCIKGQTVPYRGERKSSFMRWLCKIFKGGSSHRKLKQPHHLGEENNMDWHSPTRSQDDPSNSKPKPKPKPKNDEDLDHAVALSLAEDLRKPNGCRRPTDNDEDLARELQERLSVPPYSSRPIFPGGYRFCGGCNNTIGCSEYLGCMGAFWHLECFRCHACGQPITELEFSLSGGNPYHESCFKELHHPKCEICHQFIPPNGVGLIEYRSHPFWGQKYCPAHEHDNTVRCCSCERFEKSWDARYISLGDGRSLCLECMESAIMDTGECQSLYHAIRDFFEGLNMKLDQQIPMLLVERQALNEAIEWEKNGRYHLPETRGLCLSEEQTVSSIHRRPRIGGHRLLGMKIVSQKLTRKCEVTAILVLYGLPRLLTGSILAHELMHGWLRLKGYRNLSPEVEEGICQELSFLWLESEVLPGSRNMPSTSSASSSSKKGGKCELEKKLGEFFMHQISHDSSTAYGKGFRAANAAVDKYGLRSTLDHIRLVGKFPV